jgi:hypothetical protein
MMGEGEILVPTVSLTETESDTEGTSESETLGENASMTVGSTSSDTTGISYSRGTNESTGTSTSTNWGTGSSEGVNRGESWTGPQHNSGKQPGAPVNYSHGSSAGTSQNRGGSVGRSSSVGSSETFSSSSSHTEGTSQSETLGTSRSATRGRSLSAAKGKNYGLSYTPQVRRLYKPDELLTAFTKDNLLQLVHVRDQGPMLLFRTPYYADPDFQEQIAGFEADKVQALLPAPVDDAIQLPNSLDALMPDSEALAVRASANEGTENDG